MFDWVYIMDHWWPEEVYAAYRKALKEEQLVPVDVLAWLEAHGFMLRKET